MTTPLYQTDSYLREFEAKVIKVNKDDNSVAFDQTAFYPGGGGQPTNGRSRRPLPYTLTMPISITSLQDSGFL